MIFAAGFGTRMGTLTQNRPKPLIEVAGMPLIDHAMQLVTQAPVSRIVVNAHYHADQIAHHLLDRTVTISYESDRILETGGGLRKAMPLLQDSPVMTLNSDAVWSGRNALVELCEAWDDTRMDALLLLAPLSAARGYSGTGDFVLDQSGRLNRANGREGLVYLGAQIIRTESLPNFKQSVFSLNLLWDEMIAEGRAYGMIHDGNWCDVGKPKGIADAEALLNWVPGA